MVSDIMESNKFAEIDLPHPQTSSPTFTKEVETLMDAFDDIINSMLTTLSVNSGKSLEEIKAEIDEMDDTDDDDNTDDEDTIDDDTFSKDEEETLGDDDAHLGEPPNLGDDMDTSGPTHVYATFPFGEPPFVEGKSSEQEVVSDNRVLDQDGSLPPVGVPILEERGRSRTRSIPGTRRKRDRTVAWRGKGICHRRQSV
jgi:hypothetical protein